MPTPRLFLRACLALAVLVGTTSASVGTGSAGPIEDKRAELVPVPSADFGQNDLPKNGRIVSAVAGNE